MPRLRIPEDDRRCVQINAGSNSRCVRPRAVYGDGLLCGLHMHHKKRKEKKEIRTL